MFTIKSYAHIFVKCFSYSPFLNATEYAGSSLKADLKRRLTNPVLQAEISTRPTSDGEILHRVRLRILKRRIETTLPQITAENFFAWYNHSYIPRCLRNLLFLSLLPLGVATADLQSPISPVRRIPI